MFLPSYWKAPDGAILSEEKMMLLLTQPGLHVLDCYYGGQDQRLLTRMREASGKKVHVLSVQAVTELLVSLIQDIPGDTDFQFRKILTAGADVVCVTDLELIRGKDTTAAVIADAAADLAKEHSVILTGNQMEELASCLLNHLKEPAVYTLCR